MQSRASPLPRSHETAVIGLWFEFVLQGKVVLSVVIMEEEMTSGRASWEILRSVGIGPWKG